MVFGRKKGFLSSWTSSRSAETEPDLELKARSQKLEDMHKTLADLQFNIQVYAASWHAMTQASRAIAGGLAKLAQGGGVSGNGQGKEGASSLMETAQMYRAAHLTIDGAIREPTQRVLEETTLRETGTLLSRFPPIFGKIARRKQLLADVEAAKSRVRAAEAAKEKEKDSFAVVAGKEHRCRLSAALATTESAAKGLTAEVFKDMDRLEGERGTMLVPQVSELVGCQAYFMRRSAAVLERLAEQLPYSALALCRLLRPPARTAAPAPPAAARKILHQMSSSSTVPVDGSGRSLESSSQHAAAAPVLPPRSTARDDSYDLKLEERAGRSSAGSSTLSSPPPPPYSAAGATAGAFAGGVDAVASLVEPRADIGVGEELVGQWGAPGRDEEDGADEEVVW